MESDGDFDVSIPSSREAAQQAELLERLGEPLVDHLRSELRRMYKAAGEAAANSLKRSRGVQGNVWAGFGVDGYDGPWMWVAIRNLWSPAPRLRVAYYAFPDWRAKRRLRDAHARIELEGFEPREDYFQFEQPIPALAGAPDDEIVKIVADVITRLVDCRVFDVEIDRLSRRKR